MASPKPDVWTKTANRILRLAGLELAPARPREKPWDQAFREWIAEAEKTGADPNDVGDREWGAGGEALRNTVERFYLPHIDNSSVVLELGPGTGRVTRYLLPKCRHMILVDYSELVCQWLGRYLRGKGSFEVHHIERPTLEPVKAESVDVFVSFGVFEHIVIDDTYFFLREIARVLKPGGIAAFNFDNIMGADALDWLDKHLVEPGDRSLFRFYHPDAIRRMAERFGLEVVSLEETSGRQADAVLRKPA